MTDRIVTHPAGVAGFDPFARFSERRDLERQLDEITRGDCGAMFAAGLALMGLPSGRLTLTPAQADVVERLRAVRDANPFRDMLK